MNDPHDPLGRIAEQAARPYPESWKDDRDLDRYWRRQHREVLAPLSDEELGHRRDVAAAELRRCQEGMEASRDQPRHDGLFMQLYPRVARLQALVAVADELLATRQTTVAS